jgi:branched-chain amino acid transport system ATP-binding protein
MNNSNKPLFSVSNLQGGYGDIQILNGVSINVPEKNIVTIVGPNGAGKSTILKAVYGIAKVTSGSVTLNKDGVDIDVLATKPHNLSKIGVGYVPQIDNTFPALSIDENLEVGYVNFTNRSLDEIRDEIYASYPDLKKRFKDRAGTLSGGQRQMLAMARALMSSPSILLLDEPSLGLAPLVVEQIFQTIRELTNSMNLTVLLVEQNAMGALKIADLGIVLNLGKVVANNDAQVLIDDPAVRAAYLGY